MERMFLFAVMWAFGGALSSEWKCDDRKRFSQEWRKVLPAKTMKLPEQASPSLVRSMVSNESFTVFIVDDRFLTSPCSVLQHAGEPACFLDWARGWRPKENLLETST